jgi:hypothetical protein
MGQINLDVNKENLYEAWNDSVLGEVEGFKYRSQSFYVSKSEAESESPDKCVNETWISQLPSSLFFSLKRVSYDPKQ